MHGNERRLASHQKPGFDVSIPYAQNSQYSSLPYTPPTFSAAWSWDRGGWLRLVLHDINPASGDWPQMTQTTLLTGEPRR